MKNRTIFLFLLICAFSFTVVGQSVIITPKKTTYTRHKPIERYKKHFIITYPRVKASTPALSKKIMDAISYSSVLGLDLKEELGEIQWLEEAGYKVQYNKNGILCIDLYMEGSGAYPSGTTKTVVVDLVKGVRAKTASAFEDLPALAALVKDVQKAEIAAAIKEISKNPESGELDAESLFEDADFTVKDLDHFSISKKGVTFKYDYGFPHVIQALQPDGNFFFSWADLKPFISPGSLLTRISR